MVGFHLCVQVLKKRIDNVKLTVGPKNFDFYKHAIEDPSSEDLYPKIYTFIHKVIVFPVLIVFNTLVLLSYWKILCDQGLTAGPS